MNNQKAWSILTDEERTAISLKHGFNKSTWEAGEILKKAHYKYLEIQARASFYLKTFTEYIDLYGDLIPSYLKIDPRVRTYLYKTMIERKKPNVAVLEMNEPSFLVMTTRNLIITEEFVRLSKSKDVVELNFVNLILDFDRWNNYRILPREIQEPSAFKRRNKNIEKKNLKNLRCMNTFTVEQVIKRYQYHGSLKDPNVKLLYVPIFSKFIPAEDSILVIEYNKKHIAELSKIGFYVFSRQQNAEEFWELLIKYDLEEDKHCKEGQRFWPLFRQMSKRSLNYDAIQKVIPNRKYLENALKDADISIINSKRGHK